MMTTPEIQIGNITISVTGLGYVGLPVAVGFAKTGRTVIAYDTDLQRINELQTGFDRTGEISDDLAALSNIEFTSDSRDLSKADFHIVAVPTPITEAHQPDLHPLISSCRAIGRVLKNGDIVVFESTVYPGVTEDECVPVLEAESGLRLGENFEVGYSPERINPGDKEHRFENIIKVVSASSKSALNAVAAVYESAIEAGVYKAQSIKVAEAAKVIENTQRDLNIALVNELTIIFDRMGVTTTEVLEAAGTKWNFLDFKPGLVGGHCIGVDPYYLTHKAKMLGYNPEVILSGRRVNDSMGEVVATKLIKLLAHRGGLNPSARVGVLGLTFKENVPDLRNSRTIDIVNVLKEYGIRPMVHDPMVSGETVGSELGLTMTSLDNMRCLDALVLAVPHEAYFNNPKRLLCDLIEPDGIFLDVKSAVRPESLPRQVVYWRP